MSFEAIRLKLLVDPENPITYGIVQCGPDVSPEGIPYIRPVDIAEESTTIDLGGLQRTASEIERPYARARVRAHELVVSIGPSFGKILLVPPEAAGANLTQGTARVSPGRKVVPKFLFWAFRARTTRDFWTSRCAGATFQALTLGSLAETPIPLPSLETQLLVADFLDIRTADIDALIDRKERLLGLLEEKRLALITRAVTRGLDPSVPTKPSGVEWIGEIPEHWKLKRLMYLTPVDRQIMYGIVLPGPHVADGIPIVKSGDCRPENLRLERLKRTSPEIASGYARSRLRSGDIVYAIRGSVGFSARVPEELDGANLTQDAARISPRPDLDGQWLWYAVESEPTWRQLEAGIVGATVKGINIRDLKRPYIPLPPLPEQRQIAAYLDAELSHLSTLRDKLTRSIELLREYRQALITAAVTGKLDVTSS